MTKREAIIELYRAVTSISKIIKQLKIPKSTVYVAVSQGCQIRGLLGSTLYI